MIIARNSITLHHVRDIASSTWYYKLQASTASPPAKPTTATPSGWSTTEPTYTEGSTNSLYTVQKTTFSDGTFEYSDVSLSTSYEAAKAAYNKSVQALDAVTPIDTKTYTGLIGSANDAANASFYFAKVYPTNYTVQWSVSLRLHVTIPEAYAQDVTIKLGGYGSSFSSYDSYTVRTGSIGMYYVNLYRATKAGIETNHKGHALGIGLRSSTNPTNTSYKRTITVELLEVENCTVDMLDTAVKYANIDGTGSTNYSGLTEMAVGTAGQNATNNTNTSRTQFASAVKAGTFGCKRYTLLIRDSEDTWVSFVNQANNTGTSKTVSTGGHLLGKLIYLDSGSDYASGKNTGAVYDAREFDFRYSSNCGSTLTANKPVYLVGTIHDDGKFYFDTTKWYAQDPPTTEDGKTYIYVGMAYSTTSIWLSTENNAYQYFEGKFRTLTEIEQRKAARTATNYLASDTTGIMVANLADGHTYTPSTVPAGVKNAFIDSDAFRVRDGQTVLASYGTETSIYTTDGTELAHFGYAPGNSGSGTAIKPYYTIGQRAAGSEIGNWSLAFGLNCVASGEMSISAGIGATASGGDAVAIGNNATASGGDAIAIGTDTESSGMGSIATGVESEASGRAATSMGLYTKAVGDGSFAAGRNTSTTGWYATAFGERCVASGWGAMASGHFTEAASEYQSVRGKYNIPDENDKYAEIVGNGDEYNQSNAYALTWDGDIQFKIDTAAASGTVDRALYTELTAYGFETVIDSDGMISLKKLLTQIIQRL